jgi:hypothetical protein
VAKTGIEILTELVEEIKLLNKKVELLDQNVKALMNKDRAPTQTAPPVKLKPQIKAVEAPETKKGKMTIASKKAGVMTTGKLMIAVNDVSAPIPDAVIKIYDENDKLIKETKTNRGGIWMALLPSGRYVAEITGKFKGKDLVQQNKNFTIPEGIEKFEVN